MSTPDSLLVTYQIELPAERFSPEAQKAKQYVTLQWIQVTLPSLLQSIKRLLPILKTR